MGWGGGDLFVCGGAQTVDTKESDINTCDCEDQLYNVWKSEF